MLTPVTFHHHRLSPNNLGVLVRSPQGETWTARTLEEARAQVLTRLGLIRANAGED